MRLKPITLMLLTAVMLSFIGCSEKKTNLEPNGDSDWTTKSQVLKTIKNIDFNFPASGYAFDKKNDLINECFNALQSNIQLIKLDDFSDTIQIRFLKSRGDMFLLTGMTATGTAQPHINTLYVVADSSEKIKPPIKHELMHLITMIEWGYPHYNSTWINEGLATFAENNCNEYNVAQIYRYFMDTEKLIHIDSLTSAFYYQPEMIAYHQSAYIVQHLLKNYSIEQFKRLWSEGIDSFDSIYSISYKEMKTELEKSVIEEYPEVPNIDWQTFKEGCIK